MAALDVLAELFDEIAEQHPRTALPLLVRTVGPLEAPELGVLALDGEHPGPVLLGFTAPDDCSSLGVVSTGWSLPPDRFGDVDVERNRRTGPPAATDPGRVAVRSTVLVGRDCTIAGRLSIDGAEPMTSPPASGVILDLLLRALGCPTAPPPGDTVELFATVWLTDLANHATRSSSWPAAAKRHMALQLLAGEPDELPDLARTLADELDWTSIRRIVARGGWPGLCSAGEAAWFDEGSFARWVLGSFPPIADLAAAATDRLRPRVAHRVRAALEAWSLA